MSHFFILVIFSRKKNSFHLVFLLLVIFVRRKKKANLLNIRFFMAVKKTPYYNCSEGTEICPLLYNLKLK